MSGISMSKRHLNPAKLFDWYFSDISSVDGARYHALQERPQQTLLIQALYEADNFIHFALWNNLPEGHPVGQLWLETNTDLEATIYLAYGGFFRQALAVLRSWFEIAVYGIYFSFHYGQPTSRYAQWRRGERQAPANMGKISESIATKLGHGELQWELAALSPAYSFLSEHVHGQGLDRHDLQSGRDNVPRFLPRSFDIWLEAIIKAFNAIYSIYAKLFGEEVYAYLTSSRSERRRFVKLCAHINKNVPCLDSFLQENHRETPLDERPL